MYEAFADPYCHAGTTVLKNIPGLRDRAALERFETVATAQRAENSSTNKYTSTPQPCKMDQDHMSEFHLYIGNKCFSSWSLRPWIALKHCGIPFEETVIRLRTPDTAANLARVSPTGQVPVLLHGKTLIWETLAILEYLADLFPDRKLWPADREARSLARCVATEMHGGFLELRYGWPMNLRRPQGHKALDGAAARHALRVQAIWRQCRNAHGAGGPFLFGHFTAADAMYAPVVTRFDTYGGKLDADIRAYVDAVLGTPAMTQWYAEAAKEPWPEPSADE